MNAWRPGAIELLTLWCKRPRSSTLNTWHQPPFSYARCGRGLER